MERPMQPPSSLRIALHSRGDTRRLGARLAESLRLGDLLVLEGELGAGKTFLARAIARALGVPSSVRVTSPTFDLVHELPARVPLVHVDLYRLDDPAALAELGLADRIGVDAVVLVEWGARFSQALGDEGLWLTLEPIASGGRSCSVEARGARGEEAFRRLAVALDSRPIHGPRCGAASP